jgi:hypothetical protein
VRGLLPPILVDVRRRVLQIVGASAVVGIAVAALVWQLSRPSDQTPAGPPTKRYGSSHELSSDLYRLLGECRHSQVFTQHPPFLCHVAGGSLFFIVWTPRIIERTFGQERYDANVEEFFKPFFEDPRSDLRDLDPEGFRDFAFDLGFRRPGAGIVVGPNWMAMSDEPATLQAVHQAIGGELIMVDPTASPGPSPTESQ